MVVFALRGFRISREFMTTPGRFMKAFSLFHQVRNGAQLLPTTMDGTSPLHYLVRRSPTTPVQLEALSRAIDVLLEGGANIDERNVHGETCLHHAVLYGNLAMVELLLTRKASPDVINKYEVLAASYLFPSPTQSQL
jgi:ankyrin repeat protein